MPVEQDWHLQMLETLTVQFEADGEAVFQNTIIKGTWGR